MNIPEWPKPMTLGILVGAIAVSVAGFSWGGWVTEKNAAALANTQSHNKVISALVPICIDMSRNDAERIGKLAELRRTSTYQRGTVLMETGWATVPGTDTANRDLAQACLAALELDKS